MQKNNKNANHLHFVIIYTCAEIVNSILAKAIKSVTVQPSASCYRHQAMQNHFVVA